MRRANSSDKPVIIEVLTQAFDDNKSVNDVVKQDEKRVSRIRALMAYSFDMCHTFGQVWITDDSQACALILFPDQKRSSLRTLFLDLKLAVSAIGLSRAGGVLKREALIKSHHPQEPIAYLWFMGVHPQFQGRGIGSILLKKVISECKNKNRSIYLETSMTQNLSFYQKAGFEIFHTLMFSYSLYMLRRRL